MKYTDNLLMIAAGYSLYAVTVGLSIHYFAGINQLIPDIFSEPVTITLSQTFHQLIGSIFTGLLLVRFRARSILFALIIAIIVNFEHFFQALNKGSFTVLIDYYQTHPMEVLSLLKLLLILPAITFAIGFINSAEHAEEGHSD